MGKTFSIIGTHSLSNLRIPIMREKSIAKQQLRGTVLLGECMRGKYIQSLHIQGATNSMYKDYGNYIYE